jgi:butyryl-CoA dehydrogenase
MAGARPRGGGEVRAPGGVLQEYPWELQKKFKEYDLFKVFVPEEYGGSPGGVLDLCLVVEQLARACGGVGVGFAVNALGTFPILIGGTDDQKAAYLPGIAAGDKLVAFGLSETDAGSDAGSMTTRAERDGDDYVLNGAKKWTTNGLVADVITVFAVTDPESRSRRISAFIVEKPSDGLEVTKIEDKMGIRAIPVVEFGIENLRVPASRLVGGKQGLGFKHAMMTLDNARPGVAAQAVGCAQGALEFATVYANQRVQFGVPISSHQMVQKLLADMASKVEAARQLVYAAARHIDAGNREGNKFAAMAKCFATDTAMEVTTDAVQVFGGYGSRRQDHPDLRGHQSGPAHGHRPQPDQGGGRPGPPGGLLPDPRGPPLERARDEFKPLSDKGLSRCPRARSTGAIWSARMTLRALCSRSGALLAVTSIALAPSGDPAPPITDQTGIAFDNEWVSKRLATNR